MLQYVIRRLLYSIVVLIGATFLVFFFVASSGDPLAATRMAPNVSQETITRIEERKHLNENVFVRYGTWAKDAVTNNFGTTLLTNKPILPNLWRVMKNTLQLIIVAELLAILIAVGIGVYSALRQYSVFDYTMTTASFVGIAIPVFWFALMLQVLVVQVQGLDREEAVPDREPEQRRSGLGRQLRDRPRAPPRAAGARAHDRERRHVLAFHTRLDAQGRQLRRMRTARAKGVPESRVTMKHAFRNALIPLVTLVALNFGGLIAALIVTETVFSLDGMGLYFINALFTNDPYPIMAWLMVVATMVIVFNLIADVAYGLLDPRVRYD